MPHIELRVSPNLQDRVDGQALLKLLISRLAEFDTVNPSALKGYQVVLSQYEMGQGATDGFIHVTASILSGRSLEVRKQMSGALFSIVKQEADRHGVAASVELREMDKETYVK